jgi:hypothetical protein
MFALMQDIVNELDDSANASSSAFQQMAQCKRKLDKCEQDLRDTQQRLQVWWSSIAVLSFFFYSTMLMNKLVCMKIHQLIENDVWTR